MGGQGFPSSGTTRRRPYRSHSVTSSARQHTPLYGAEASAQAVVEDLVADADDQAADQRRIDAEAQFELIAVARAQLLGDPLLLRVVERNRADDLTAELLRPGLAIALERPHDLGQPVERALLCQREQEVAHLARSIGRQRRCDAPFDVGAGAVNTF